MNRLEFFEKLVSMPQEQRTKIQWAYELAKKWHKDQPRDTGVRYFEHVRNVASLLAEYGYTDYQYTIVGILHDSVEDTAIMLSLLEQLFGYEIARDLISLSRTYGIPDPLTGFVTHTVKRPKKVYYAGIEKASKRVIIVKGFDRIDNLSTLPDPDIESRWTAEKRIAKVNETREYIIPLVAPIDPRIGLRLTELAASVEETALRMQRHSV